MEKIKLMVDTPSDIEPKDAKKLNIDLLPVTITYKGKSYKEAYDMSKEKFYKVLSECEELPTTAQVAPTQFLSAYEKAMKDGYTHVILVTINAGGSGTFNSACLAKTMFEETYGKDKMVFELIDSHAYTYCYGRPVMLAAEMIKEGKSFSEIVSFLKYRLNRVHAFAYMSTLKFAGKSGRISMTSAIVGETLGLKPIVSFSSGKVEVCSKCRGEKSAISKLIESVKEHAVDLENQEVMLIMGSVEEKVKERLRREVAEKLNPGSVFEGNLGCSICNNIGPQTVAILFTGKNLELFEE